VSGSRKEAWISDLLWEDKPARLSENPFSDVPLTNSGLTFPRCYIHNNATSHLTDRTKFNSICLSLNWVASTGYLRSNSQDTQSSLTNDPICSPTLQQDLPFGWSRVGCIFNLLTFYMSNMNFSLKSDFWSRMRSCRIR
jgi:hypothetical protein